MIPYGHQSVDEEDIQAVVDVLRSDWLTQGPNVPAFEQGLAAYCGTAHAVAFSSGTTALLGAYFALDMGPGDEFITTPMTFVATANAGVWHGATPVFADIDPETGNIDPSKIEALITAKTKVIVPVDFGGRPADIDAIRAIADAHHLPILEDACHALGATYKGRKVGSLSDLTTFSFHPIKPIAAGEGGAVVTDNPTYERRLRQFRNHGVVKDRFRHPSPGEWYYEMEALGINGRLSDIHAALGLNQLKKLDRFIDDRRKVVARYHEQMMGIPAITLPREREHERSGWHLFPIRLCGAWEDRRAQAFSELRSAGIGVQVHYIPVYRHPYYEDRGYRQGLCPAAERFYETEISLPVYPSLSEADQDAVIEAVRGILA